MTEEPVDPRHVSGDGFWRWDGDSWVPLTGSAISLDGRWRWDGTAWRAFVGGSPALTPEQRSSSPASTESAPAAEAASGRSKPEESLRPDTTTSVSSDGPHSDGRFSSQVGGR